MFGSEASLEANGIAHLYDIYVKINTLFKPEEDAYKAARKRGDNVTGLETGGLLGKVKSYFKSMEEGDEEKLALWERFRTMSIERYKRSYARLNIVFDEYSGESQVKTASMNTAEAILKDKGIAETNEGATIIDFKKYGAPKLDKTVLRNKNGTTNYLLRDVGAAIERAEAFSFDKMIYVVMSQQDVHLAQLFKILELMGGQYTALSRKLHHVNFGAVKGMSTRRGNVRFLDDILHDCATAMHDVMRRNESKYAQITDPEQAADTLAVSAVMVQDMSGKRINGYPFDLARMTSFEGDTGPYLQYAHARLCSVARKAGYTRDDILRADTALLTEPHAVNLLRVLAQYPDTVQHTLKTLEPATILTYLFRLTHQLSSSYDVLRVVGAAEGPETSLARAALYEAARQVLGNGMRLLGLSPVERWVYSLMNFPPPLTNSQNVRRGL
jgi:arginyl-tRNA synthetase